MKEIFNCETSVNNNEREIIDETIIDGSGQRPVLLIHHENNQSLICGFTIRNGQAEENGQGSGIDIRNGANPVLRSLIITDNTGGYGAVYVGDLPGAEWEDLRVENNRDEDQYSTIHLNDSDLIINNSKFSGNTSFIAGVFDLFCPDEGSLTLNHCEINDNSALSSSVAEIRRNSVLRLNNCTVLNNGDRASDWFRASDESVMEFRHTVIASNQNPDARAIVCGDDNNVDHTLTNCTIVGFQWEAIRMQAGAADVINTILWGNALDRDGIQFRGNVRVSYSDVEGYEVGSINEDPMFVNADEGDYHLTEDSPCIDAGDPCQLQPKSEPIL